jgi:hypothetical protein
MELLQCITLVEVVVEDTILRAMLLIQQVVQVEMVDKVVVEAEIQVQDQVVLLVQQ